MDEHDFTTMTPDAASSGGGGDALHATPHVSQYQSPAAAAGLPGTAAHNQWMPPASISADTQLAPALMSHWADCTPAMSSAASQPPLLSADLAASEETAAPGWDFAAPWRNLAGGGSGLGVALAAADAGQSSETPQLDDPEAALHNEAAEPTNPLESDTESAPSRAAQDTSSDAGSDADHGEDSSEERTDGKGESAASGSSTGESATSEGMHEAAPEPARHAEVPPGKEEDEAAEYAAMSEAETDQGRSTTGESAATTQEPNASAESGRSESSASGEPEQDQHAAEGGNSGSAEGAESDPDGEEHDGAEAGDDAAAQAPSAPAAAASGSAEAAPAQTSAVADEQTPQGTSADRNFAPQPLNPHQRAEAPADSQAAAAGVVQKMQGSFGEDFSSVGISSNLSSGEVGGAKAVATDEHVAYDPAQVDPSSGEGQKIIGHELAHIVQKRRGKVEPDSADTYVDGRAKAGPNTDNLGHRERLEREADDAGSRAAEGGQANVSSGAAAPVYQFWGWDDIKKTASQAWSSAKSTASGTWNAAKQSAGGLWASAQKSAGGLWTSAKKTATGAWNSVKQSAGGLWNSAKNTATGAWNSVKQSAGGLWNSAKKTATGAWNSVKQSAGGLWNSAKKTATGGWNSVKQSAGGLWNSAKNTASGVWDGVKKGANWFTNQPWLNAASWAIPGLGPMVNLGAHLIAGKGGKFVDQLQTVLDVVGVVDPTGIADGINAVIHLARGNYAEAALSAISMIPYIGDVFGKGGKIVNRLRKIPGIAKLIEKVPAIAKKGWNLAKRGWNAAKPWLQKGWDGVKRGGKWLSGTWNKVKNGFKKVPIWIKGKWDGLKRGLSQGAKWAGKKWQQIKSGAKKLPGWLRDKVEQGKKWLGQKVGNLMQGVKSLPGKLKGVLKRGQTWLGSKLDTVTKWLGDKWNKYAPSWLKTGVDRAAKQRKKFESWALLKLSKLRKRQAFAKPFDQMTKAEQKAFQHAYNRHAAEFGLPPWSQKNAAALQKDFNKATSNIRDNAQHAFITKKPYGEKGSGKTGKSTYVVNYEYVDPKSGQKFYYYERVSDGKFISSGLNKPKTPGGATPPPPPPPPTP